jgi:integrase
MLAIRTVRPLAPLPARRRQALAPSAENAATVYLATLADGSKDTMRRALAVIADLAAQDVAGVASCAPEVFPWGSLRAQHTGAIRARLAERYSAPTKGRPAKRYSAATVNKMLSALRATLKEAWRLEQMTTAQYAKAADLAPVKGSKPDQAAGHAVNRGELVALATVCADGTAGGARDAAMLALAYAAGLRRAEIVGLDLADVDQATGVLKVRGKGNKVRTVPVDNGALEALGAWLQRRGDAPGPLFLPMRKGGRLEPRRMTTQGVYKAFAARAAQARVRPFSPHDLRRTFAGDLLDAGADIATVQKMMGHASVTTTAGYDRRGERAKADAAKKLHFPYMGAD